MTFTHTSRKLIHEHVVADCANRVVVPNDYTKIARQNSVVSLVKQPNGKYPTTGEHYVTFPVWNPGARTAWDFLAFEYKHGRDSQNQVVTEVLGRLHDGTTHIWWDGSGFAPATDEAHWNDLGDLSRHLDEWDLDSPLGVVVRLKTSNPYVTPTFKRVAVLFTMDLADFVRDWIFDTVVASLSDNLRPLSDVQLDGVGANV